MHRAETFSIIRSEYAKTPPYPMGYSGGMSPDNVIGNLRQINKILPNDYPTWIDAEGKLKSNDLFDEKPKFDVELAKAYVTRANIWKKQNSR